MWTVRLTSRKVQVPFTAAYFSNGRRFSTATLKREVRIGCASGFWGDTWTAVPQLVNHGKLDYLVMDYLSEVTMSLLVAAKQKNNEMGWCPDFAQSVGPLLPKIKQQGIKVVANAGGVNPEACMKALMTIAEKSQTQLKIALVTGDDLLPSKDSLTTEQCPIPAAVTSANAYLGAGPICRALELADIVITGRCTDSALALGPLMHSVLTNFSIRTRTSYFARRIWEFKWKYDDFDLMASGSLAGHLIECGAQSTGGIFTDWENVLGWEYNGFPIAVCQPNGEFLLTKPKNTGGLVSFGTAAEQLLYEIDNPRAYILPDVICDFSNVRLREEAEGVWVSGAKGRPPTPYYKIGGTYLDGYKCICVCPIIGPRAREKARKVAEALLMRARGIFQHLNLPDFTKTHIQVLGTEEAYGESARKENLESRDVVLWVGVQHSDKKALEIFGRELASAGTGMAPGLCTIIGGRPKPGPLLRFFSYLTPKDKLHIRIKTSDGHEESYVEPHGPDTTTPLHAIDFLSPDSSETEANPIVNGVYSYRLSELAWLRSGDKGDTSNIGVIARDTRFYHILRQQLTSDKVAQYFEHKFTSSGQGPNCQRYDVPGIQGLNFVLKNSLGGGGIGALNPDPLGKGFAQMLADFKITNVPKLF